MTVKIGDILQLYPNDGSGPVPGIVCKVWSDRDVNLAAWNQYGTAFQAPHTPLLQAGEAPPSTGAAYAVWPV